LADGTNTYLYGSDRIGQFTGIDSAYFLGDALGSVRQLVDGSGAVILAKSYEPYGEVLWSEGETASSYGYTAEMQNGDLVYLRARYYRSYLNQFIQADTIEPSLSQPQLWNRYSYAGGNPVRFTDPSGFTYCDSTYANPNECNAPNIHSYNPKVEPESLSWISNQFGDKVTQYLAPIYDRNGQIVYRTNAAQFLIDGHEMSCEYIQIPGPDGKLIWDCPDGGTYNQNLCGQVTISAIVYLFDATTTARKIVEQMGVNKKDDTGYGTLHDFMNVYYKKYLYAETQTLKSLGMDSSQLPNYLAYRIASGNLIVSAVTIKHGGSKYGGQVNPSGEIGHWVMITGISREWKNSDEYSAWNWVRIFNPFDNETEYYWWGDFGPAWGKNTTNQYTVLLVNPHHAFRDN
jgi:RHS repeat-associated protein